MKSDPPAKNLFTRLQLYLAQARFFTFSALLHLIILIMAGSVVLIRTQREPADFTAPPGEFIESDAAAKAPPNDPIVPVQEFTPSAPKPASVESPAITVQSASAKFAMNTPDASITGAAIEKAAGSLMTGKSMDEAIRRGMPGGTMSPFGMREQKVNALTGTFYDLKQTRRGKPTGISPDDYQKIFRRFVQENWRDSVLSDYFKGPNPLHATQIMIPNMAADEGPKAFGLEKEVQPSRWLVHYKARVSPPEDGTYHFVGAGDDVMLVRFNGKLVLDRCWSQAGSDWEPERNYDYGFSNIPNGFAKGDAIQVRAGQNYDMEVLIGEQPGGLVFACLLIEKDGATYAKDERGNPILPPFRLAEGPMPELEKGQTLPPYDPSAPAWKAVVKR